MSVFPGRLSVLAEDPSATSAFDKFGSGSNPGCTWSVYSLLNNV